MPIHTLRNCRVEIDDERRRAETVFSDGSRLVAAPVMDEENIARARTLGYRGAPEDAVWAMTRHHDLVHSLVAEAEGWTYSPTLHAVANGRALAPGTFEREERIVFLIQRLLNVGLPNVLGDHDGAHGGA
ncbi:MAG: hypothetical protein M3296_09735 [Actinomycetota bacterium]|nr:hypothetical protein [Actinomycetota bacterium]